MLGIPTVQELMYGKAHFSDAESASPVARSVGLPASHTHGRHPSQASQADSVASSQSPQQRKQTRIEDLRNMILAMEQRQDARMGKLDQKIQEAEAESKRFEELRKEVQPLAP